MTAENNAEKNFFGAVLPFAVLPKVIATSNNFCYQETIVASRLEGKKLYNFFFL